jgi:hypothetical protein
MKVVLSIKKTFNFFLATSKNLNTIFQIIINDFLIFLLA